MEMIFEQIREDLENRLKKKRYEHVLRVVDTAVRVNKDLNLGLDEEKVRYASLLHDCAKNLEEEYFQEYKEEYGLDYDTIFEVFPVAHAKLGAIAAKERYGVEDLEILEAIECHTMGKENMTLLDKLVFIADFIEPGRDFEDAKIVEKELYKDFDKGLLLSFKLQILHLIENDMVVGLDIMKAWNYLQRRVNG